jgi:hypothetical protein
VARRVDPSAIALLALALLFAAGSGTCTLWFAPPGPVVQGETSAYSPIVWFFGGLICGGSLGLAALSWRGMTREAPKRVWRTAVDGIFASAFSALAIGYAVLTAASAKEPGALALSLIIIGAPAIAFGLIAYYFWRRLARRRHG